MILYDEFYPNYMGEDDIELDVALINSTRNYNQYKADGGFLDKLTYFEVLSQVRENKKTRQRPYSRKVERVQIGDSVVLKDSSGQEYAMEVGDSIEGAVE